LLCGDELCCWPTAPQTPIRDHANRQAKAGARRLPTSGSASPAPRGYSAAGSAPWICVSIQVWM
jgi:hypothetical protein